MCTECKKDALHVFKTFHNTQYRAHLIQLLQSHYVYHALPNYSNLNIEGKCF